MTHNQSVRRAEIDARKLAAFEARLNARPKPHPQPAISRHERRLLLRATRRRRARLVRGDTVHAVVNRTAALRAMAGPLNALAAEVATKHGVLIAHLVSPERYKSRQVCEARYEFLRRARENFRVVTEKDGSRRCVPVDEGVGKQLSFPLLAELAGYCNHTALMYAVQTDKAGV